MTDLSAICIDANKHDMLLRHYERMFKIAQRISNRVNRRWFFFTRVQECEARLEEGIHACNGWEHQHIEDYKEASRINEAMIEVLKDGLYRLNRTYPQHIEQ